VHSETAVIHHTYLTLFIPRRDFLLSSLHATVRYNPPPELVKILLDLVPESPTCIDIARRTPLHVAVGMRANPSTIELLVRAYPNACAMLDWEGKTPLHLACDDGFNLFNEEDNDTTTTKTTDRPKHCLDTIRTLINACPLAAVVEDQDDMTALEHAIMSNASIKVVGLLQGITCRQSMKVRSFVKKISEESSIVSEEPDRQLNSRSLS